MLNFFFVFSEASDETMILVLFDEMRNHNVKNIIFEPIYLSNSNDFTWYVIEENWKKVSEMKILEYVNYLGGTYSNNGKC